MSDRARQFMPFSPLKGFGKLLREKERVKESKRELTEDEERTLSKEILQIKKGMMVKIVCYSDGEYISVKGIVTAVDLTFRTITIVKNKVSFDDIFEISIDNSQTEEYNINM